MGISSQQPETKIEDINLAALNAATTFSEYCNLVVAEAVANNPARSKPLRPVKKKTRGCIGW